MNSIFFDTSALFSAVLSSNGAARELMRLAVRGQLTLFISDDVITEAKRNIENKASLYLPVLIMLLDLGVFKATPELTVADVQACAIYTEAKDAMIVAAAIKAKVDFLATFDRKHLIDPPEVRLHSGLNIATPGTILSTLRSV